MAFLVTTVTLGAVASQYAYSSLELLRYQTLVLLLHRRHVARDVDERDDGDVEGVAEADEAGRFDRKSCCPACRP